LFIKKLFLIASGVSFATNSFKAPMRPLPTGGDAGCAGIGDPYPRAFRPTTWGDGTPAMFPNITPPHTIAGDGWICAGALVGLLLLVLFTATVPYCVLFIVVFIVVELL
jgi:hypothetical protein